MIECLSIDQMYQFISVLDQSIVEMIGYSMIIIQAEVGEVFWIFNEKTDLFCQAQVYNI
jgi:hypothetical protein